MSENTYSKGRTANPKQVEALGMMPPGLTPAASPVETNPLQALAKRRPAPAPSQPAQTSPVGQEPRVSQAALDAARRRRRSTPKEGLRKGSTMRLDDDTLSRLEERRDQTGESAGEIVIAAIEHCYPRLSGLLALSAPQSSTRAAGFASRQQHNEPEKTGLLAYRLSGADYDNLDNIRKKMGARSRTHL